MLFNSYEFLLLFLPAMLLGWWVFFRRPVYRLGFLALMSWIFYSAFEFPTGLMLLPLLLASTSIDYVAGVWIDRSDDPTRRKRVLVAALAFNLAILAFFKYLGFFERTLNGVLSLATGGDLSVPVHDIILPIGISFYTFNSMSYTIDIYRRRVRPARNFLEYAAFVALFPHLIAGPIVRYSDIEGQLQHLHQKLTSKMVGIGLFFFGAGLFKKLVIADSVAPTADRLFNAHESLTLVSGWAAALGYTMQLYFDFSAYSDMAVGLAMLMGLRFPQNFDSPYKAVNISDFWRRWHMTLSRWLRDYLFIPLGGSRGSKARTLRNLFLTMFIGGLWHGAAFVFVLWGVGHGLLLVVHNIARDRGWVPSSAWVARAITFVAVVVLWVPFRAGDLQFVEAGTSTDVMTNVLSAMVGLNGLGLSQLGGSGIGAVGPVFLAQLALLLIFVNVAPNTWNVRLRPRRIAAVGMGVGTAWAALLLAAPSPFLYFQF